MRILISWYRSVLARSHLSVDDDRGHSEVRSRELSHWALVLHSRLRWSFHVSRKSPIWCVIIDPLEDVDRCIDKRPRDHAGVPSGMIERYLLR